jgi:hypothetical protein
VGDGAGAAGAAGERAGLEFELGASINNTGWLSRTNKSGVSHNDKLRDDDTSSTDEFDADPESAKTSEVMMESASELVSNARIVFARSIRTAFAMSSSRP